MPNVANFELKQMLKREKIPYWQIAEKLNVHESTIIRWLRIELSPEQRFNIIRAAYSITQERGGSCNEQSN